MIDLLTNDCLFKMLNLNHIRNMERFFSKTESNSILNTIDRSGFPKIYQHKISSALFEAITDVSSYPFYILSSAILAANLSFSLPILIPILCIVSVLTLVFTAIFFLSAYLKLKKEARDMEQSLLLLSLKMTIANVLIGRLGQNNTMPLDHDVEMEEEVEYPLLHKMKQAISAAMWMTSTLFIGYYLSTPYLASALSAYAAASCLSGPIGIGIALCLTIGVGIYFGYKNYKAHKQHESAVKFEHELSNKVIKRQQALNINGSNVSSHSMFQKNPKNNNFIGIWRREHEANPHVLPDTTGKAMIL